MGTIHVSPTLQSAFRDYWQRNGDVAQFGYLIAEEFAEVSRTDGKTYKVQYFALTKLENHPELPQARQISIGLLGYDILQAHGLLP